MPEPITLWLQPTQVRLLLDSLSNTINEHHNLLANPSLPYRLIRPTAHTISALEELRDIIAPTLVPSHPHHLDSGITLPGEPPCEPPPVTSASTSNPATSSRSDPRPTRPSPPTTPLAAPTPASPSAPPIAPPTSSPASPSASEPWTTPSSSAP